MRSPALPWTCLFCLCCALFIWSLFLYQSHWRQRIEVRTESGSREQGGCKVKDDCNKKPGDGEQGQAPRLDREGSELYCAGENGHSCVDETEAGNYVRIWIEVCEGKGEESKIHLLYIPYLFFDTDWTLFLMSHFFIFSKRSSCHHSLSAKSGWWWIISFDGYCIHRPEPRGMAGDTSVTCQPAPPQGPPLQYALILDNERSLEGEATAEITDPL